MKNRFALLIALATGAALAASAHAAPIMFGTFTEPSAAQGFTYTNVGGAVSTISVSTPVDFEFTAPTGLTTIDHAATLTITCPAILTPASTAGFLVVDQPISLAILSIIENGTGKNLLTANFTGDITGKLNTHNADLSGDDTAGNTVTYSSDFLTFAGSPGSSFNLGLATLSPSLSIGPGGFLNSFIANIDGQFSADNVSGGGPGTPEPASLATLALGATALLTRRRTA
ncbi:MAG: PEP-CTERM sorting domain-containing protein [Phycisphaerae bacterium]